jgi:hypothetical protein
MTEEQSSDGNGHAESFSWKALAVNAKDRLLSTVHRVKDNSLGRRISKPLTETRPETNSNLGALIEYASIERYGTPELRMGETTEIPTSRGKIRFLKESDAWQTDRNEDDYDTALFSGEYKYSDPLPGVKSDAILRTDGTEVIAGGKKHFFEDGDTFLDLGSGEGVALIQNYLRYRSKNLNAKFIGVDHGYQDTSPLDLDEPGVQLIHDDWGKLDQFPPNSIDRFSSVQGAFRWGEKTASRVRLDLDFDENVHATETDIVQAITRVAKTGAILRFDCEEDKREGNEAIVELEKNGWEVKFEPNTAVAVKKSEK